MEAGVAGAPEIAASRICPIWEDSSWSWPVI
jgi:hypothetical protein